MFFDGVDDYIDCGAVTEIGKALSVSVWAKHEPTTDWDDIAVGPVGGFLLAFCGKGNTKSLGFLSQGGPGPCQPITHPAADLDGNWHHLFAAYDGRRARLYVDGKMVGTARGTGRYATGHLTVGGDPRHPGESYRGLLDEFILWDRSLTEAEIRQLYQMYKQPQP
jgi:hypothetical protein